MPDAEAPLPPRFAARLAELHVAASPGPWWMDKWGRDIGIIAAPGSVVVAEHLAGEANADLLIYLRNHAGTILALVEAVEDAAWGPSDELTDGELRIRAALRALNG